MTFFFENIFIYFYFGEWGFGVLGFWGVMDREPVLLYHFYSDPIFDPSGLMA